LSLEVMTGGLTVNRIETFRRSLRQRRKSGRASCNPMN
jgi:hypothetical protein